MPAKDVHIMFDKKESKVSGEIVRFSSTISRIYDDTIDPFTLQIPRMVFGLLKRHSFGTMILCYEASFAGPAT
jgi:hypothetical protein